MKKYKDLILNEGGYKKKKVENLMNEFQDNRFYRSANTSEELVEKLLYGRTSDSN